MALYDYVSDDGERMTVERPMTSPPPNPLRARGKRWYRDWGGVTFAAPTKPSLRDGRFVAHSLPRWDPDAPAHQAGTGKPLFSSRQEVKEYLSKKAWSKEADSVTYAYGED